MASNVNLMISNWQQTGQGAAFACRLDASIEWVDDAGVKHTASDTLRFPAVMAGVPAEMVQEQMTALMLVAWRAKLGVDTTATGG